MPIGSSGMDPNSGIKVNVCNQGGECCTSDPFFGNIREQNITTGHPCEGFEVDKLSLEQPTITI